jgi:hypothetical protein
VTFLKESFPDRCCECSIGSNTFPKHLRPFAFYRKSIFGILPNISKKLGLSSFNIKTNDLNNLVVKSSHLEEVYLRNFTMEIEDDLNFDEEVDYR